MLDLDSLAEKCARDNGEGQESWRAVIWSVDFQRLAKSMSDGEVMAVVKACKTLRQLQGIVNFLLNDPRFATSESPFSLLIAEATRAGQNLNDWIASFDGKSNP